MESNINFEKFERRYDLLQIGEDQALLRESMEGPEAYLDMLSMNSPVKVLWHIRSEIAGFSLDDLSPAAFARLHACGPVRSNSRAKIAQEKHLEAIASGEYQALIDCCDSELEAKPESIALVVKAEILLQMAKIELGIKASKHLDGIEDPSHEAYVEAFRHEGESYELMRKGIEAQKAAIKAGHHDLYPELIVNLRDFNFPEEMIEVFREMLDVDKPEADVVRYAIQSVYMKEDQMLEVLAMFKVALEYGYINSRAAMDIPFQEYRDKRISQKEFKARVQHLFAGGFYPMESYRYKQ